MNDFFICYRCRAGLHKMCVGVPCRCDCAYGKPEPEKASAPEWQDVKTARKFAELAGHDWEDLSESARTRLASKAAEMRAVFTEAGRNIDSEPTKP